MDNINNGSQPPIPPVFSPKSKAGPIAAVFGALLFIIAIGTFPAVFYYLSAIVHHSKSIQGNPSAYDPIKYFSEAQEVAGPDAQLYEMEAKFVKPDGTMDLNASYKPAPSTTFTFYKPADKPKDAPPTGAGSESYSQEITVMVEKAWTSHGVSKSTANTRTRYTYWNFGIAARFNDPNNFKPLPKAVPAPKCDLATLWQSAEKEKNNPEAVSTIIYNKDGYDFRIYGTKSDLYLKFDMDCKLKDESRKTNEYYSEAEPL